MNKISAAFTLIELLVVIAIIAILAVVVVLTLNPAQLLAQSRDANRVSDLASMNSAINLYLADQGGGPGFSIGSSSTTYVSLPDATIPGSATSTCTSLGLASLSSGYSYQCSSSQSYRNTSSSGWLPVDLSNISEGSPLGILPIDPVNQSSSGLYYTYSTNGSQFELTSIFESQKYKAQYTLNPPDSYYPGVDIQGSSVSLSPLFNPAGLVGWWPLNEGAGTVAHDQSGSGNNGALGGSTLPQWQPASDCRAESSCLSFSGASYVQVMDAPALDPGSSNFTITAWFNTNSTASGIIYNKENLYEATVGSYCGQAGCYAWQPAWAWRGQNFNAVPGQWTFIATVYDHLMQYLYKNGVLVYSIAQTGDIGTNTSTLVFGARTNGTADFLSGLLSDIHIYDRALSPAEIGALYAAGK